GEYGEDSQNHSSTHGGGRSLDAPDHEGYEPRYAKGPAQIGAGEGEWSDEDSGNAGQQTPEGEGEDGVARDVGAHGRRDIGITRDGHANLAKERLAPQELEQSHYRDADEDRHDLLPGQLGVEDGNVLAVHHVGKGQ